MGTPIFKLVYDRRKRASKTKYGSIELQITYLRRKCYVTTGVRVMPNEWKRGQIVNRLDALEMQRTLDTFTAQARRKVNDLMEAGELDMKTLTATIQGKTKKEACRNVPEKKSILDFFEERAIIRSHGMSEDSKERYQRFIRWFREWGGMQTFEDLTPMNIIAMDEAIATKNRKRMKDYSKWQNYHRFLYSFILDAIDEGLLGRNPYKQVNIRKDKTSKGLGKYLSREELMRVEDLELPNEFLEHARDLFVFQTYTFRHRSTAMISHLRPMANNTEQHSRAITALRNVAFLEGPMNKINQPGTHHTNEKTID